MIESLLIPANAPENPLIIEDSSFLVFSFEGFVDFFSGDSSENLLSKLKSSIGGATY